MNRRALCWAVATLAWAAWGQRAAAPADPTPAVLEVAPADLLAAPVAANWPSYNGDYTGRRFSALAGITPANVSRLAARWVFHARNSDRLETTPAVIDGVMFVTSANDCFALDARTGRVLWHYARAVTAGLVDDASGHHNRGVGLWRNRVYMETDNAHLLCLDARSGHLIWDVQYADTVRSNYGATSAPLVVKDLVLVGTSGGDDGVRGFIAAFDARTGRERWRFWTIPAPGETGSKSWPGRAYLRGGGTTWMPGTYDPELNTVYWGTGNPAPDFDGAGRPGDDLYTDCVLALDPDNGKLKWYFQFTPHDLYDYDATETPVLVDGQWRGQRSKLLVEANRNGFLYVLDRVSGQFLAAYPFVDNLNWAAGIDGHGRPIRTGIVPTPGGAKICPSYAGATNWYSPTYNPGTGLFYFLANKACNIFVAQPQQYALGSTYYATGTRRVAGEEPARVLLAIDPSSGRLAWSYPQVGREGDAGAMSTAGGLVFFGDTADSFEAVDARSGAPLWHFNTGQALTASPMTYALDGVQYVAIAAGSDVFSFALPAQEDR